MVKKLRVEILDYLVENDAVDIKIEIAAPFLLDDDSSERRSAVANALQYLSDEKLILLSGMPTNLSLKSAGSYASKYHTGLKASITREGEKFIEAKPVDVPVSVPAQVITHNYHLDNAISPVIGDNNVHSLKAQNINNANNKISGTKTNPVKKWILGIIATIIAGLIVWYLTKK